MSTSLPNIETAWKQEVNDRLAAHRTRRTRGSEEHPTLPGLEAGDPLKSSIAAKVAARYAKAPTYSEMLAAEARKAAVAAAAAAVAAREAQAAAQAILTGLDLREEEVNSVAEQAASLHHRPAESLDVVERPETKAGQSRPAESSPGGSRLSETPPPRWQHHGPEPESAPAHSAQPQAAASEASAATPTTPDQRSDELRIPPADGVAADDDRTPPQPIHANLIEFPRELFATRRARPRLAEGPLRDEARPGQGQMRIFEVEPESISTTPLIERASTEWSSIRLGAHPVQHAGDAHGDAGHKPHAKGNAEAQKDNLGDKPPAGNLGLPLNTASLEDRSMAAIVDFAIVTAAFLLYVFAFALCTSYLPTGKPAIIAAVISFLTIAFGYQLLFFAFAESTPGMRYAKIALCTFEDENPSRSQMRLRVASLLLSLCPLGLGCAWVFFDEDHLSWHDRITRTYQRSYR